MSSESEEAEVHVARLRNAIDDAERIATMTEHQRLYPTELTPALIDVLGQPNYKLHQIWMSLREVGVSINQRYEDEQAAALHFLIPFALEHGHDWQRHAADRLVELRDAHVARRAEG